MRKVSFAAAALAAMILALAGPSVASAKKHVPPGSSQLDQYIETLPGPAGGRPSGSVHGGDFGFGGGHGVLPATTARQLQSSGVGQKTANVASETAVRPAHTASGTSKGDAHHQDAGGRSGTGQVANVIFDEGGGMGVALPLILIAIAIAGIAFVALTRVRNRPAS